MNGLKNLLDGNVDEQAWKGYIVRNLEDLNATVSKLDSTQDEINRKLDAALNKCENCDIDNVVVALYGSTEGNTKGLFTKLSDLETAFKIKSSMWGVLGGGLVSILSGLVYLLIKHGMPVLNVVKESKAIEKIVGQ